MNSKLLQSIGAAALAACGLLAASAAPSLAGARPNYAFDIKVSAGALSCLPRAAGRVLIHPEGDQVEVMQVAVWGMPPNIDLDVFIIQVPNPPFGMSWYQGDLHVDEFGNGIGSYVGRFNIETFMVAPGKAGAPVVHSTPPFPDAAYNPPSGPIHMWHLGLWFNSPADAKRLGCRDTVTPFNGDHKAGIQALNSANFPDAQGPLRNVRP